METPVKKKRIVKNRATRSMELSAASESLFLQKGYINTSIEDVVKLVGVSHGTFYYHFPTKEDVLISIVRNRLNLLKDMIEAWCDDDRTPEDFLNSINSVKEFQAAMDRAGFGLLRQDAQILDVTAKEAIDILTDEISSHIEEAGKAKAVILIQFAVGLMNRGEKIEQVVEWSELKKSILQLL